MPEFRFWKCDFSAQPDKQLLSRLEFGLVAAAGEALGVHERKPEPIHVMTLRAINDAVTL